MNPTLKLQTLFLALILLGAPGCVCDAVKSQAETMAAVSDGYKRVNQEDLDKVRGSGDLGKTPLAVKVLLQNVLNGQAKHAKNWHEANHALNGAGIPVGFDKPVNVFPQPVLPPGAGGDQ
jgi:hypothetical protein